VSFVRRHRWLQGSILIAPAAVWALVFIAVPTFMAIRLSFWHMSNYQLVRDYGLGNYDQILHGELYRSALVNALQNGVFAAFGAVVLSVPLAHFIRFCVPRHRTFLFGAVVVRILLGTGGILNGALTSLGIVDHPVSFLVFSDFAVFLAQTHLAMPFAFIPIYAAMERVPVSLLQAGADLGASRRRQFLYVELPNIARGIVIGATFAFILAFGDFFAPTFVGPPSSQTIGNLAADNFRAIINWPFGAALGVVMMVTVLLALGLMELLSRLWTLSRSERRAAA
jgi:spermidine/putrescine transport system permease protein